MNIIDSSAWLEFFADTPNARHFLVPIQNTKSLIVPVITIYEVFRKVLLEADEKEALKAIAHMKLGQIIDIDMTLAISAAGLGREYRLPLADSLILATARKTDSVIWTQDKHFKDIVGVKYFKK